MSLRNKWPWGKKGAGEEIRTSLFRLYLWHTGIGIVIYGDNGDIRVEASTSLDFYKKNSRMMWFVLRNLRPGRSPLRWRLSWMPDWTWLYVFMGSRESSSVNSSRMLVFLSGFIWEGLWCPRKAIFVKEIFVYLHFFFKKHLNRAAGEDGTVECGFWTV